MTKNIVIEVKTKYIETNSIPEENQYLFAYTITINNQDKEPCQLLNRYWLITDANNSSQEVYGEGVVGEQPYLNPGEFFTYTSSAVLKTPKGYMQGYYEMVDDKNEMFKVKIPAFSLNTPSVLN